MNFQENQIIDENTLVEASIWCNANRGYYAVEIDPVNEKRRFQIEKIPEPSEEEIAEQELNQAKEERAEAVSKIIVEVDGMKFDGDETAQTRMGRTISAAIALGVDLNTEKRIWVLADNTVAEPTVAQLAQALKLASDKQTELWTVPYEEQSAETLGLAKVGI